MSVVPRQGRFQFTVFFNGINKVDGRFVQAIIIGFWHCPGQRLFFGDIKGYAYFRLVTTHQGNIIRIRDGIVDHLVDHQRDEFAAAQLICFVPAQGGVVSFQFGKPLSVAAVSQDLQKSIIKIREGAGFPGTLAINELLRNVLVGRGKANRLLPRFRNGQPRCGNIRIALGDLV